MSAENPNPADDIMVQCRNKNCPWFGHPKWFPPELSMAPGEQIICGGCGNETRFIGNNRPKRTKPFDPKMMNRALPGLPYEEG